MELADVNNNFVAFHRRIAAIKCIMSAFQVHDHVNNPKNKMRHQIADVTYILIPKLVGTFTVIALEKETSNDTLKTVRIIYITIIMEQL